MGKRELSLPVIPEHIIRKITTTNKHYIAVDFDGTLVKSGLGELLNKNNINYELVNYLKTQQSKGNEIILHTCRNTNDELEEACDFIYNNTNFKFDKINESSKPNNESRKIWYDILFDDRCTNVWGNGLLNTIEYFENNFLD